MQVFDCVRRIKDFTHGRREGKKWDHACHLCHQLEAMAGYLPPLQLQNHSGLWRLLRCPWPDKSGAGLWHIFLTVLRKYWNCIWRVGGHFNRQSIICYRDQTNSYKPVTKVRGGNWACATIISVQADIQYRIVGGPFG